MANGVYRTSAVVHLVLEVSHTGDWKDDTTIAQAVASGQSAARNVAERVIREIIMNTDTLTCQMREDIQVNFFVR